MTFQESEYPNLKKEMINLIHKYESPALVVEVLREIWETHKQVPLYPGIISMCLPSMVKEKRIGELKRGDKALIRTPDGEVVGTVKSKKGKRIILENPEVVRRPQSVEIKKEDIKKILVLEKGVLGKIWPTLVFEDAADRQRAGGKAGK